MENDTQHNMITVCAWVLIVVGAFRAYRLVTSLIIETAFNFDSAYAIHSSYIQIISPIEILFAALAVFFGVRLLKEEKPPAPLKYIALAYVLYVVGIGIWSFNIVFEYGFDSFQSTSDAIRLGTLKNLAYLVTNLFAATIEAALIVWAVRKIFVRADD